MSTEICRSDRILFYSYLLGAQIPAQSGSCPYTHPTAGSATQCQPSGHCFPFKPPHVIDFKRHSPGKSAIGLVWTQTWPDGHCRGWTTKPPQGWPTQIPGRSGLIVGGWTQISPEGQVGGGFMKPPQRDGDGTFVLVDGGLVAVYPGAARASGRMVKAKSLSFICRYRVKTKNWDVRIGNS